MTLSAGRLTPELPYLDVFYAVCTEGGFTAAARRLGCSQPAISYQIRALERTLEAKLIERGGQRVVLTAAGERMKSFCGHFFAELDRVRADCRGLPAAEPLRLGSASGFGRYVLVPALRILRDRRGADQPLELRFDAADVVLASLERGDCEAAFVYSPGVSNRLRYRRVYDEELVLIGTPALDRQLGPAGVDRLMAIERMPFVTYEESEYVFGRWFESNFGEQPAALRSAARFSELEEVVDFVGRGAGLSIVPRFCVPGHRSRRGGIRILYRGRGVPCLNQVFMVVRSGTGVRPELQQLVGVLSELAGRESRSAGAGVGPPE